MTDIRSSTTPSAPSVLDHDSASTRFSNGDPPSTPCWLGPESLVAHRASTTGSEPRRKSSDASLNTEVCSRSSRASAAPSPDGRPLDDEHPAVTATISTTTVALVEAAGRPTPRLAVAAVFGGHGRSNTGWRGPGSARRRPGPAISRRPRRTEVTTAARVPTREDSAKHGVLVLIPRTDLLTTAGGRQVADPSVASTSRWSTQPGHELVGSALLARPRTAVARSLGHRASREVRLPPDDALRLSDRRSVVVRSPRKPTGQRASRARASAVPHAALTPRPSRTGPRDAGDGSCCRSRRAVLRTQRGDA